MKVLWLSHLIPYPPKGGVLQRSYNLLRETARRHEVHLLAFVQKKLLLREFGDVEYGRRKAHEALSEFCSLVRFVDIPAEAVSWGKQALALRSLFGRYPYTINWLRSRDMENEIAAAAGRCRFDVVHFDTISLAPYLRLFPRRKVALDHHNIESHMMLRRAQQEKNRLRKLYFLQEGWRLRRYEERLCERFDAHFTCSPLDSARLMRICSTARIQEIPNGVDDKYFEPTGREPVSGRLVFAGGLNWYPNRDAMLYFAEEVWPTLKMRFPQLSIDVVGDKPPPVLLALARQDSAFMVHGYVDDVRPYLDRAAIYVCPIRDGGGTKLKILDAFAMGKPTVAHPAACEGIDITPGKDVLLAATPDEYTRQIGFLFENPAEARRIGTNARNLVMDKYLYSRIGEKLSDAYRSLTTEEHGETTAGPSPEYVLRSVD